jgi:hypothetical protein
VIEELQKKLAPAKRAARVGQPAPVCNHKKAKADNFEDQHVDQLFEAAEAAAGRPLSAGAEQSKAQRQHAEWQEQLHSNKYRYQKYVALCSSSDREHVLVQLQGIFQERICRAVRNHCHAMFDPLQADGDGPAVAAADAAKPWQEEQYQQQHAEGGAGQVQQQQHPAQLDKMEVQLGEGAGNDEEQHDGCAAAAATAAGGGPAGGLRPGLSFHWQLGAPNCNVVRDRQVKGVVQVWVPTIACSVCSSPPWEVNAQDCGCAASAPVQPGYWVERAILDLYTSLGFTGNAMASFAAALTSQQQEHWWAADPPPPPQQPEPPETVPEK